MSDKKPINLPYNPKQQRGLSLVELMIAMTLGLFLIWGVTQSFLTSRQVYDMQQALSRIQENTRMAQEFIAYDIRNAGDYGCAAGNNFVWGAADVRNDLPNCGSGVAPNIVGTPGINMITSPASVDDDFKYAVYGFDNVVNGDLEIGPGGKRGELTPAPKVGTDVLMVRVAQEIGILQDPIPNGPDFPPALAATIPTLTLASGAKLPGVAAGEVMAATDRVAVSDCATTKIFGINGAVNTDDLAIPLANNYCSAAAFQRGASVRKLSTIYYYVAVGGNGGFSLYRAVGNEDVVAHGGEELLEGVEDMQLQFGVDNLGNVGSSPDGIIDVYKKANVIGDALDVATEVTDAEWNGWDWVTQVGPCPDPSPPNPALFNTALCSHVDFNLVRAVRYSLLLSAGGPNLMGDDQQQLLFNNTTVIGGVALPAVAGRDRRLRQVVTSTVGIRSRSN